VERQWMRQPREATQFLSFSHYPLMLSRIPIPGIETTHSRGKVEHLTQGQ